MTTPLPKLPFAPGETILELPPSLANLREQGSVHKVITRAGDPAWLITSYEDVRALFADTRVGRSHPNPNNAPRFADASLLGGPAGEVDAERASHQRMRRLLTPAFSARRMSTLRPRIATQVSMLLDQLADHGPVADLHKLISTKLPVLVTTELLGVPYEDHDRFRAWSSSLGNMIDPGQAATAFTEFTAYIGEIAAHKRDDPSQDLISDLVEASVSNEEIAGLCTILLFAAHESTMVRIDYGTVFLLTHPEQVTLLRADSERWPAAIEEILRIASATSNGGIPRYAHHDIQLGGNTIKAGDALLLAAGVAGRDPAVYNDPDRFTVTRDQASPHLAFGHGPHYCIGASLARIELQELFPALFNRFPTLQLAIAATELPLRENRLNDGIESLPVTWT